LPGAPDNRIYGRFWYTGQYTGNCAELPFPATRVVHQRRPYRRRKHTRHTYRRSCAPGHPEVCEVGRRGDRPPRTRYEGGFATWTPTGVTFLMGVPAATTTAGPSRRRPRHPPHTTGGRPGHFSGSRVIHRLSRESTPVRGGGMVGAGGMETWGGRRSAVYGLLCRPLLEFCRPGHMGAAGLRHAIAIHHCLTGGGILSSYAGHEIGRCGPSVCGLPVSRLITTRRVYRPVGCFGMRRYASVWFTCEVRVLARNVTVRHA
jgi:hypothetical protein